MATNKTTHTMQMRAVLLLVVVLLAAGAWTLRQRSNSSCTSNSTTMSSSSSSISTTTSSSAATNSSSRFAGSTNSSSTTSAAASAMSSRACPLPSLVDHLEDRSGTCSAHFSCAAPTLLDMLLCASGPAAPKAAWAVHPVHHAVLPRQPLVLPCLKVQASMGVHFVLNSSCKAAAADSQCWFPSLPLPQHWHCVRGQLRLAAPTGDSPEATSSYLGANLALKILKRAACVVLVLGQLIAVNFVFRNLTQLLQAGRTSTAAGPAAAAPSAAAVGNAPGAPQAMSSALCSQPAATGAGRTAQHGPCSSSATAPAAGSKQHPYSKIVMYETAAAVKGCTLSLIGYAPFAHGGCGELWAGELRHKNGKKQKVAVKLVYKGADSTMCVEQWRFMTLTPPDTDDRVPYLVQWLANVQAIPAAATAVDADSPDAGPSTVDGLVLEWCLGSAADLCRLVPGGLSRGAAKLLTAFLLTGLEQLERRRTAHLDLKPDNQLLTAEGCLVLCDLGLAQLSCSATDKLQYNGCSIPYCDPQLWQLHKDRQQEQQQQADTAAAAREQAPSSKAAPAMGWVGWLRGLLGRLVGQSEPVQQGYTMRADVYSVGVCAVEFLGGRKAIAPRTWGSKLEQRQERLLHHMQQLVEDGSIPQEWDKAFEQPDGQLDQQLLHFLQHCCSWDPSQRWSPTQLLQEDEWLKPAVQALSKAARHAGSGGASLLAALRELRAAELRGQEHDLNWEPDPLLAVVQELIIKQHAEQQVLQQEWQQQQQGQHRQQA